MFLAKPCVLFFDVLLLVQTLFPSPLQFTGHQAILRFDCVVLTSSTVCRVPGSLKTQPPVFILCLLFSLQIVSRRKGQLDGSWFKYT